MSIRLCARKSAKRGQGESRFRRSRTCRIKRIRYVPRTVLNSLTDKTDFVACYDELKELCRQFSVNFKISESLQSRRGNARCNGIVPGETKEQAPSKLSDTVQDNMTNLTQLASSSQISQDHKSEAKNMKQSKAQKNSVIERKKGDKTIVSTDSKCRTKNLVIDQAKHNKGKHSKVTRENTKNKAEVENTSSIGNVLKENCNNEIINNDETKKRENTEKRVRKIFSDHIPVLKMLNILKKKSTSGIEYIKGNIRINPYANKYAYLKMNNEERDLLIIGLSNRNRAFEGDLVVACVSPERFWQKCPDGELQKTGKVVCILEKVHPRKAVGCIKKQDSNLIFYPKDQRVPLVEILPESMPPLYHAKPELYNNIMFRVTIDVWDQLHAFGRIISVLGKQGELDTELNAIILENDLDLSPYHERLLKGLPGSDYVLTDADMKDREDWRHECIFTIDPATAADLDDALSYKVLENGNYEIGVHISDVTHYLEFFSPLDIAVSKRATTVYLPQMTFHMLPKELCKVCSLLPGKDKLAFSVIWEMTPNAEIVKHRFAKTVIRSCCQMSYDSAEAMIENPEKTWPDDFLDIRGNYTASLLSDLVNKLFKLSTQLQKRRFGNGALRLDKPKLQIHIDPTLSQQYGIPIPVNYYVHERKNSNSLIEEFMLLTNITVAAQLYITIPKTALLRIHKDPSKHCLVTLKNELQKYGIHLDIETAGSLQDSIRRYGSENKSVTADYMNYIMMVVVNMCSKSMARAEYVCASTISPDNLKHFALNVPCYTHFTSPIRRYSDCIVHRLLDAVLGNKSLPEKWTVKLCSKITNICNIKKYSAKIAQEQSTDVLFTYMVGLAGGFEAVAVVVYVKAESIEVILCDTGVKLKANLKDLGNIITLKYSPEPAPTVTVCWVKSSIEQVINVFSLVHVRVIKISEELRLKAILLPPSQKTQI